jgi:O-antigen/teichoic acid export membrane protein
MSPETPRSIEQLAKRGVVWKFLSEGFTQVSRVIFVFVLARLLTPEDYGLAAEAMIFTGFVLGFSDLALGAALVQRRRLTEADRSTVFWLGLGVGLCLTVLGVALSGPMAELFGSPEVQDLMQVLSISFVVVSLGTTQKALLTREMSFRTLELRVMTASLAGWVVGVVAAFSGAGPWSLIAKEMVDVTVATVFVWLATPWRPRAVFSRRSLVNLGGFSSYVLGARVAYYTQTTVWTVLVGRTLGPKSLGIANVSSTMVTMPVDRIAMPVAHVLWPAFSHLQSEPARIGSIWLRTMRAVAAVSFPSLAGLAVVAPDFVSVVLGERWNGAAPVIQVLTLAGAATSIGAWNQSILMALGRANVVFAFSVLTLLVDVIAVVATLQWGVVGVASGISVAVTAVAFVYLTYTARSIGVPLAAVARALAGPTEATALMLSVVLPLRLALDAWDVDATWRLPICIAAGVAAYLPAVYWRAADVVADIQTLVPSRLRRGFKTKSSASDPEPS